MSQVELQLVSQKTDSRSSGGNFMALSNFRAHTKTNLQASRLSCSTLTLPVFSQYQSMRVPQTRYAVLARVIVHPLGPYPTVSTTPRLSWRDLFLQPWHRAEPAPSPLHKALHCRQQTPLAKLKSPAGEF